MRKIAAAIIAASFTIEAGAAPIGVYPVQTGAETARFRQGVPTLNLEAANGAVQITPLPFDHGHVVFGLAIYNRGKSAANLGIENMNATIAGTPIAILSREELEKRAKSRAVWSQVGLALLAGAAAASAAQAHTTQTSHGTLLTPHGAYSWTSVYRDNTIGTLGAGAALAGGAAGISGIQNRLDWTLDNLAQETVQTTTIDPEASYGGKIQIEKSAKLKIPYDLRLEVSFNGDVYPFVFRVTQAGVSMPAAYVPKAPTVASTTVTPPPNEAVVTPVAVPAISPTSPPQAPAAKATTVSYPSH